jgi:hypothetical protein
MKKADKIANFIKENNPRRKEIIKFIVVTLNGANEAYFDKNRNEFRGYYAVAFQNWNRNQKIVKNPITQKYSVTHYYERDGKLYSTPLEVRLERALKANKGLTSKVNELYASNRLLTRKLIAIENILID